MRGAGQGLRKLNQAASPRTLRTTDSPDPGVMSMMSPLSKPLARASS